MLARKGALPYAVVARQTRVIKWFFFVIIPLLCPFSVFFFMRGGRFLSRVDLLMYARDKGCLRFAAHNLSSQVFLGCV